MNEVIVTKALAIIDSCLNEQHIEVATKFVNLVCFEPGVGLTSNQTQRLLNALNQKINELQQQLRNSR